MTAVLVLVWARSVVSTFCWVRLKAETVNATLRTVFKGEGPLLFMASPTPIEGGEKTLLAALSASQAVAVAPPAAGAQVAWPYASFGKPDRDARPKLKKITQVVELFRLDIVHVHYAVPHTISVEPGVGSEVRRQM